MRARYIFPTSNASFGWGRHATLERTNLEIFLSKLRTLTGMVSPTFNPTSWISSKRQWQKSLGKILPNIPCPTSIMAVCLLKAIISAFVKVLKFCKCSNASSIFFSRDTYT